MAAPRIIANPVPINAVTLTEGFWKQRQDTNRRVTLPMEHEQCSRTGRIDAFRLQWREGMPNKPHNFWDSDIAKWIEAVAYSLMNKPDAKLEKTVDRVIDLVVSAQRPDGYLNIFYSVVEPGKRWTNLRDMHELYCAGHLMEGAVAYYQATGKRKLLDCLARYADYIAKVFGPGRGQKRGYCGHPEIELALVKLHRATREKRYLDLAKFFVLERGRQPHYFELEARQRGDKGKPWAGHDYYQAHKPLLQQQSMEGHSVRALYLLSGMIDVAAETGNARLFAACKRLFENCVQRRMYITGAAGSARHGERFTYDYDLPNETAYAETCANIALALAAWRMLQVEPDGKYADIMERALYNGVVSGVSLKGDRFFYANPLAIADEALKTQWGVISANRQPWFDCACCPPNIARLLGEFNQLIYAAAKNTLYVNLYAASVAKVDLAGLEVGIEQRTQYPWDGKIRLVLSPSKPARFKLALHMPEWCHEFDLRLNGRRIASRPIKGYVILDNTWSIGDTVELVLPMKVVAMETNPRCRNNAGKIAIQRGPVVYCAEEIDNGDPSRLVLDRKSAWTATWQPKTLGGVVVLNGKALQAKDDAANHWLYRPAGKTKYAKVPVTLVPYCAWGNRKVGKMGDWLRGE